MAAPQQTAEITKFPKGVSSFGMPIVGGGARETTGRVFFVDSTSPGKGDDLQHGTEPTTPFATLNFAISQCVDNRGDIIYLLPGHAENITATNGVSINKAGVSIVGLTQGRERPKLTFTTVVSADVDVNAANVLLENIVFDLTGISALTAAIDVHAADCTIYCCEFVVSSVTTELATAILTDSNAHRLRVLRCEFIGIDSPPSTGSDGVRLSGTPDGVEIAYNFFYGEFSNGAIWNSADAPTHFHIHHNRFFAATDVCVSVSSGTGIISYNELRSDTYSNKTFNIPAATLTHFCAAVENYWSDGKGDYPAVLIPVSATAAPPLRPIAQELLGANISNPRTNFFMVSAALATGLWASTGKHEVLVVNNKYCRIRCFIFCRTSVSSAGGMTISFGYSSGTTELIGVTTASDLATGDLWFDVTPTELRGPFATVFFDVVTRHTIGFEILVAAPTGGTLEVYTWWEPLEDSTAAVTAGAGATF